MQELPLISIVTPAFNAEKTIARAIESVLNQTYPRVEYIIMDGASSDATVAIAESYADAFAEKGYIYRICSEKDDGMYDALNKGVLCSTGDIIGQINADDDYEPIALARVAEAYGKGGFDYFYADLRVHKKNGSMIKRAKYTRFATTRHWNHPTTFIRADIYKAHPYALRSMFDDFELILRLRKEGYRPVLCHEVLANFRFGGMSTKKSVRDMFRRIGYRRDYFKRNGYSFLHTLDGAVTEIVKFLYS